MEDPVGTLSKDIHAVDDFFHPNETSEEREDNEHYFDDLRDDEAFFHDGGGKADTGGGEGCKKILHASIFGGKVRAWDLLVLIPTVAFLIFLLLRFRHARMKLLATNSPIFRAFYALVFVAAAVGVVRCLVSMTASAADPLGSGADKALWILLRFVLLATEMSVVVFGLAAGHLESRASAVRRVVAAAAAVSFVYAALQAVVEFGYPDPSFRVESKSLDLYGHGGAVFWLASSVVFDAAYAFVLLLRVLPCRHSLTIPHKRSFYGYAAYLLLLNLISTMGAALMLGGSGSGICFVNLGTYLYFTTFAPVVYFTFLQGFFRVAQPHLLFSYKSQLDEFDGDDMMGPGVGMGGGTLEFTDAEQNNTPIVLNSSALFHQAADAQQSQQQQES